MIKAVAGILLKIFLFGLLLVLLVAVGTEVVALHRNTLADPRPEALPVVVRKAAHAGAPLKTVRAVPGRGVVSATARKAARLPEHLAP